MFPSLLYQNSNYYGEIHKIYLKGHMHTCKGKIEAPVLDGQQ